jgi:hypothetical protein
MHRLNVIFAMMVGLVCMTALPPPAVASDSPDERQGGEDIDSAVGIWSLPFSDQGTTDGYLNDYDEECPNPSTSPDVVYFLGNGRAYDALSIDLCDSNYDTKVYVYQIVCNDTLVIACNDDYPCPGGDGRSVQSRLDNIPLEPCRVYYIVIDGGNDESGDYNVEMRETKGACCLPSGACMVTTEADCDGVWMGADTVCDPNPCPSTEVESESWGMIKTRFGIE